MTDDSEWEGMFLNADFISLKTKTWQPAFSRSLNDNNDMTAYKIIFESKGQILR